MTEEQKLIKVLKELLFESMCVHVADTATTHYEDAEIRGWMDEAIQRKLKENA